MATSEASLHAQTISSQPAAECMRASLLPAYRGSTACYLSSCVSPPTTVLIPIMYHHACPGDLACRSLSQA